MKLKLTVVLNSTLEIEVCELVRFEQSRRGEVVVCFVKNAIWYNKKPIFCINGRSTFIEIFFHLNLNQFYLTFCKDLLINKCY